MNYSPHFSVYQVCLIKENRMNRDIRSNDTQIGGDHYKIGGEEHWDRVFRLHLDYFQAQITKYVERCWKKNGLEDLKKARHFLDKYIELHEGAKELPERAAKLGIDLDKEEVSPTGWIGYTFEGVSEDKSLFTCKTCKTSFYHIWGGNPNDVHICPPPTI
jgi:hypothetical protein